ncbi:D-alanyl-D-alanine carboxypeptidase [Candidatus Peregrinibacteria bacterium]|jgi:serine-type D-Ala-D-Ala carboxypeptidase (penicillin-binding protein 5/6)|nr:D-alanyl-D-alanine carboxypeptidase [Candidatus Peregrinibacteria bacterium]
MLTTLVTLYLAGQVNTGGATLPLEYNLPTTSAGIEILSLSPIPIKAYEIPINLTSHAALVMDVSSNKILYEKNIDKQLPIASITKIMTAVIALEEIENLEEIAIVSRESTLVPGSKVWLSQGEKIKYKDLLNSLLISSGNDAAFAIAENVAGSQELFVQKMNAKAKSLGMENTHFANSHGLDDPDNYSTASDIALLAGYALKKNFIRSIIDIKELNVMSASGISHHLTSTNKLLGVDPEIKGLKTGSTLGAGECLVALAINPYGNEIVTVILNSQARFQETQYLKDKIWEAYVW